MSNINSVFGLSYFNSPWGVDSKFMARPYTVAAGDSNALFIGDCVTLTGTSDVAEDGNYYPTVTRSAAGDVIVGVVLGFKEHPDYLNQLYRTASTLRTVYVIDNPAALFEVQATSTFAATGVGGNYDLSVASGSTVTGLSGMQLDTASYTASSAQLRVIGLSPRVVSEFGLYTKLLVMINEHAYKLTTGV